MNVDPKKTDKRGKTPIQMASIVHRLEIVELLLETGQVHVNDQAEMLGDTALHFAALTPNVEMTRYLLKKGANPKVINWQGETPLHWAVNSPNSIEIIDLFLETNLKIDVRGEDLNTPLHNAIRADNLNTVRHLLEKGADPNLTCGKYGSLRLHFSWQPIQEQR